jgi:hypothetical protein
VTIVTSFTMAGAAPKANSDLGGGAISWAIAHNGEIYGTATEQPADQHEWSGYCWTFVVDAFGGAVPVEPTAEAGFDYYNQRGMVVADGTPPPAGTIAFYSYDNDGHAAVAIGGGQVIGTQGTSSQRLPVYQVAFNQLPLTYLGWVAPEGILTSATAADHVLRVSATGTAYLADANGVPHWIPDALTYLCDVAEYPPWNGLAQSQVDALGNGKPWATRCARHQDAANHVLRVSATGTAYLADANGVPHWIPDALTYLCDVARYPLFDDLAQSQVDALGNGKPWATRCARPQDAANHVLRVSATGTAYLADANGVPHWIPDALTYLCDVARYPLFGALAQSQVDALGNGKPWASRCARPQDAANHILIVSTTNTSYYADANGVPHWIPNIFILNCLVAKEIPVYRGIAQSQVDALGNGKPWATCSTGT